MPTLPQHEALPRERLDTVELPGEGYVGGSADRGARWGVAVCRAWIDVMRADPVADLSKLVEDWVVHHEEGSADFDSDGES